MMNKKTDVRYGILGSGRLAHHLSQYFKLLKFPYQNWSRKENSEDELFEIASRSSHLLLAVSDSAISELSEKVKWLIEKDQSIQPKLVHLSGAITVEDVTSAHPLMTFPADLQSLQWYERIPFAISSGQTLEDVLPGLKNRWFSVEAKDQAFYHALVSMAGNFPFILWQKTLRDLSEHFGISNRDLIPYLQQVLDNFSSDPIGGLTGPIARKDGLTIKKHLEALDQSPPLKQVYESILNLSREGSL